MVVFTLEQRWEILRQIDLQKLPILSKKISELAVKVLKAITAFLIGNFFLKIYLIA